MKQSKLRKRRVIRFAILYFVMLVIFVALIVGPLVAGKNLHFSGLPPIGGGSLVQPTGLNHNDTSGSMTGTGALGGAEPTDASATTAAARMFRNF